MNFKSRLRYKITCCVCIVIMVVGRNISVCLYESTFPDYRERYSFSNFDEVDNFVDEVIEGYEEDGDVLVAGFNQYTMSIVLDSPEEVIYFSGYIDYSIDHAMVITVREMFSNFLMVTAEEGSDIQVVEDWESISSIVCEYGESFIE